MLPRQALRRPLALARQVAAWLLTVWMIAGSGVARATPVPAYELSGREDAAPLGAMTELRIDRHGTLAFADVRSDNDAWTLAGTSAFRLGLTSATYWLHMRIRNGARDARHYIVDLSATRQDHLEWIVVDSTGRTRLNQVTGDRTPRSTRPMEGREHALPLSLDFDETVDVYVRIRSHDGLTESVAPAISERSRFLHAREVRTAMGFSYMGAGLALLIYNLFLFVSTRSREFIAYVAYLGCVLVFNAAYMGIGFEFFWPSSPAANYQAPLVAAALSYASFIGFAIWYLRIDRALEMRRQLRILKVLALLNLAVIPIGLMNHYAVSAVAVMITGACGVGYVWWLSLRMLKGPRREARFLFAALIVLFPGVILFDLQLFGFVDQGASGIQGVQIGTFCEMMILAFGLADSMNALKAEKLAAERLALDAQRAMNEKLEAIVNERTGELERANRTLTQLAVTDALTGAFNRRHFNEYCLEMLRNPSRTTPFALCMFDIDHFKRYNDTYGHKAGDDALRAVAQAATGVLRRAPDRLFRLGGEEFGVFVHAETAQNAAALAQSIGQAIRNLQISHVGNPAGIITASFGVAWWTLESVAEQTPESMYVQADRALYRAKHAGRDRVVVETEATPPSGVLIRSDASPA